MSRLDSKLTLLRSVQVDLNEESRGNDRLGEALATRLASEARPAETAKYKLHVQEVGHITSLLLGLSGRLARAENALIGLREDHCDRVSIFFLLPVATYIVVVLQFQHLDGGLSNFVKSHIN